jgi:hypothetical protein
MRKSWKVFQSFEKWSRPRTATKRWPWNKAETIGRPPRRGSRPKQLGSMRWPPWRPGARECSRRLSHRLSSGLTRLRIQGIDPLAPQSSGVRGRSLSFYVSALARPRDECLPLRIGRRGRSESKPSDPVHLPRLLGLGAERRREEAARHGREHPDLPIPSLAGACSRWRDRARRHRAEQAVWRPLGSTACQTGHRRRDPITGVRTHHGSGSRSRFGAAQCGHGPLVGTVLGARRVMRRARAGAPLGGRSRRRR